MDNEIKFASSLVSTNTLIQMDTLTDQVGLQFYSGNFLDGTKKGKSNTYHKRSALCLETHHFPDSPNHPNFPNTILNKGQTFKSTTQYRFTVASEHDLVY